MKDKYIKRNSCRRFNNVCALVIMLVFLFNILLPNIEYSELENRYLQKMPKLTVSSIKDGSFMEDFENYLNDHFIGRNMFVKIKAGIEYLLGKQENNDVYVGSDDYLIQKPAMYDEDKINANLNAIKTLNDLGRYKITVSVIPPAFEVMKDKLPENAYRDTILKLDNHIRRTFRGTKIKNVDTTDDLKRYNDSYLYYRTDHHTTSNGAFIIYNKLSDALGYKALSGDDFKISDVSRSFYGTTYSKALRHVTPDIISDYKPLETARFKVEFPYENKESDSMYFPEHLKTKDKYSYFLDGNHALTVIKSPNKNGKSLVVFKDSYANCTVPMIANHFETVHMIDLRYYNDDIIKYLHENKIKNILFLYSSQTFMTDESISKIESYAKNSPYCTDTCGLVEKTKAVGDEYFKNTAFIGDSLTDGFRLHTGLFDSTFLCGTSMTVAGIYERELSPGVTMLDRIRQGGFKKVYIMLGINEYIVPENRDAFLKSYSGLIDTIKESNPDALIYIQSILPVAPSRDADGRITNDVINLYNDGLYDLSLEKEVYYLDINKSLSDANGQLPESAATDGVHLKTEYYLKWFEYLKTHAIKLDDDTGDSATKVTKFKDGIYNVSEISKTILENITFRDELSKINSKVLVGNYGIDERIIQNASGYAGGGATAEEIAVFEVKDSKDVRTVEKLIYQHIESKKKSFESYIPEEMPKLKRPFVYTYKNLVILCIADNYSDLESKIKTFLK